MTAPTEVPAPPADVYSSAELGYLLAGRSTPAARRAREYLDLDELGEGDAGVLAGAQSLVAAGRARVADGEVALAQPTAALGFVLGTASKWVRVSVWADESLLAMAFVQAPESRATLMLRILPLGNVEALFAQLDLGAAVESLVGSYLERFDAVSVAVRADGAAGNREVGIERADASSDPRVIRMHRVPGQADAEAPTDRTLADEDLRRVLAAVVGA